MVRKHVNANYEEWIMIVTAILCLQVNVEQKIVSGEDKRGSPCVPNIIPEDTFEFTLGSVREGGLP